MGSTYRQFATASAVLAAAFLIDSPAGARPVSIRTFALQELRVATIAYRIAVTSAAACATREVITGLVVHDLTRYERAVRPAVSRAFSMQGGFGVLAVVPGSAAADSGLRVDDEILAVGPYRVADPGAAAAPQSYVRMEQFEAALDAALDSGKTELLVRRGNSTLRLPLRAEYGCGGKLALKSSSTLNAWADGKRVLITTGMTELSQSTDEIAFVIAHEMAHNILGHSRPGGKSRGIFGFSRVKRGEIEADQYAVRLMARAGYRPAGGIAFLETARKRLWWNVSLDHPSFGRRIELVSATIRSVQANPTQAQPAAKTLAAAVATRASAPRLMVEDRRWAAVEQYTLSLQSGAAKQLERFGETCER